MPTPNIAALLKLLPQVQGWTRWTAGGYHQQLRAAQINAAARCPDTGYLAALEAVATLQKQVRQLHEAGTKACAAFGVLHNAEEAGPHYHDLLCAMAGLLAALAATRGKETA